MNSAMLGIVIEELYTLQKMVISRFLILSIMQNMMGC